MNRMGWLVFSLFVFVLHSPAWAKQVISSVHGGVFLNGLAYRLFIPSQISAPRKLVVAIHGCKEDAEHFAKLTQLDDWAERDGFLVLYPQQDRFRNPEGCWNWFYPFNQMREVGEAAVIASLAAEIAEKWNVSSEQSFLMGLSSGAAIAVSVASCHPDKFSAVMLHSGVQFKAAEFPFEAIRTLHRGSLRSPEFAGRQAALCAANTGKRMAALIVHGTKDERVVPLNGEQTLEQFAHLNAHVDPALKALFPLVPYRTESIQESSKLSFLVRDYGMEEELLLRHVSVEGLGHAWSGGPVGVVHSDPLGPDATALALEFFKEVSR